MLLHRHRAWDILPSERWWQLQQSENHAQRKDDLNVKLFTLTIEGTLRGGECNDRLEWVRGRGLLSPMPEAPAIKNKWKVHWDLPPVEWKVCPENTESPILFERIKLIKQFAEKRTDAHEGEKMLDDKIYPCVENTVVLQWKDRDFV